MSAKGPGEDDLESYKLWRDVSNFPLANKEADQCLLTVQNYLVALPDDDDGWEEKKRAVKRLVKQFNNPELFKWVKNLGQKGAGYFRRDAKAKAKLEALGSKAMPFGDALEPVGFDVEKVAQYGLMGKNVHVAGQVAVVGRCNGKITDLLNTFVNQPNVKNYMTRYSGMTPAKMSKGILPLELTEQLEELFEGKLIVTKSGQQDFISCGLDWFKYKANGQIFEIDEQYQLCYPFNYEKNKCDPRKLKHLAEAYFPGQCTKYNFQRDANHDPSVDALFTLMIFEKFKLGIIPNFDD